MLSDLYIYIYIYVVLQQHVYVGGLVVRFDTLSLWHSPTFTEVLQQDRQHHSLWKGDTADTSSIHGHTLHRVSSAATETQLRGSEAMESQTNACPSIDQTTPQGQLVALTKPLLLVT